MISYERTKLLQSGKYFLNKKSQRVQGRKKPLICHSGWMEASGRPQATCFLQKYKKELKIIIWFMFQFPFLLFLVYRVRNWALKFGVDLWEFGRQFTKISDIKNVSTRCLRFIIHFLFSNSEGMHSCSPRSLKVRPNSVRKQTFAAINVTLEHDRPRYSPFSCDLFW